MCTPSITDRYRQQMQRRLDRASRRFRQVQPLLTKLPEGATAALAEAQSVEDDFSHIIGEMKSVMFDFGGWCSTTGSPMTGNQRMNHWRDAKLNNEEKSTWDLISEIRNFDVHREPLKPGIYPHHLSIKAGGGYLRLEVHPYVVRFELRDGSPHSLKILSFCKSALAVMQKFVSEFDQL